MIPSKYEGYQFGIMEKATQYTLKNGMLTSVTFRFLKCATSSYAQ
jgi:hypothetical protein